MSAALEELHCLLLPLRPQSCSARKITARCSLGSPATFTRRSLTSGTVWQMARLCARFYRNCRVGRREILSPSLLLGIHPIPALFPQHLEAHSAFWKRERSRKRHVALSGAHHEQWVPWERPLTCPASGRGGTRIRSAAGGPARGDPGFPRSDYGAGSRCRRWRCAPRR